MLTIITVTLAVGLSVGAIIGVVILIIIIAVVSPVLKVYQQPLFKLQLCLLNKSIRSVVCQTLVPQHVRIAVVCICVLVCVSFVCLANTHTSTHVSVAPLKLL